MRGVLKAPEDVVLLSMDEASYSELGISRTQAWPRIVHAKMLRRLKELGAKRVVMDIVFLDPGADPAVDEELAAAMAGIPIVLGADTGSRNQGSGVNGFVVEELLTPYAPFAAAAEKIALVKMPERDGFLREFILPRSYLTKGYPTLYEAAAGVAHEAPGIPSGRDLLWYYGPPGQIPTYAYYQVFPEHGALPDGALKDKVVFVGLNLRTGVGAMEKDSYKVPFRQGTMFGVEVQATAAANILANKWIKRASQNQESLIMTAACFFLVLLVCFPLPHWGFVALVLSSLSVAGISYAAFISGYFVPGVMLLTYALPLAYLISTVTYYFFTYRSQQKVKRAFALYLPKEMAKKMSKNPDALKLGGEDIVATALFTDIAGFTSVAEKMTATEVSKMLNVYFTRVTKAIFAKEGTVIKFIGDAIFVIWGAPLKQENHARLACEAALAIGKVVEAFNAEKIFPALHTRVGVHTGSMVVGNLGSEERFDYTAIGDAVNFAARLEGLNKYFGTSVLVSGESLGQAGAGLTSLFVGKVKAAGKAEGVPIHTLLYECPAEARAEWEQAVEFFRKREWDAAEPMFRKVIERGAFLSRGSSLYLMQIQKNRGAVLPTGWDGEISFSEK